jgi:putative ABC transport system permease protein
VFDFPIAPGDYPDIRAQATHFEELAAVVTGQQPLSGDNGEPEQIVTAGVTTNFFSMLGARVQLGRDFAPDDGTPAPQPPNQNPNQPPAPPDPNAPPPPPVIAILSQDFWQRRYGGDPGVVGRTIDLGGGRALVVGVLQPGVELLFPPGTNVQRTPDLWAALRIDFSNASRINVFMRVIGKLKPGVSLAAAQKQLDDVAADLRRRFPIKEAAGLALRAEPMHADLVAGVRPVILALMGAVVFVLLIACANVANLLLVRASWRERELAVRAALGGSRWVIVRQMMAESLVLATVGGLIGLLLAHLGIRLLVALRPEALPRVDVIGLDPTVLAFTAGVTLLSALIFGVVPALRASRPDLAEVLRQSGRTPGLQGGGRLLRDGVVMAEVALSFVLLIGSGLMLRSFVALTRVDPGFDPRGVLTFVAANANLETPDERAAFARQLRERLLAVPGVRDVTAGFPTPLDGSIANARWGTEQALTDPSTFQQANTMIVLPGYFEAMRVRLLDGRTYTEADNVQNPPGIIIDDRLAAKAFPGQSAVGKRILVRVRSNEPEWLNIIGVVAHQRHESLAGESSEQIIQPQIILPDGFFGHGLAGRWLVRTTGTGDPTRLVPAMRAAVRELDARVPVAQVRPMQAFVDDARAPTRFALVLIGVFAIIAAVLAAVGLYGVLSTLVRQRTAEIGVRLAFGAPTGTIFQLVIGQGLRLSAIGVVLGVLGALALTRVLASQLVGVTATDPVTFAGIAVLFLAVAAIACWLPARRAAALDPSIALREG